MAIASSSRDEEVIGLIPAGGLATRLAPLPVSKEVYPVGFRRVLGEQGTRPKVACHYLLEKMKLAGISKAYIVLKEGKWDIPAYLRDGSLVDMHLAYLLLGSPFGTPYTLDQAYPFVEHSTVAFGFPDILFQGDDAFVQLRARQKHSSACVILGLCPADQPDSVDMVDWKNDGSVHGIIAKPRETHLSYSWCIALWTPEFTRFVHDYVAAHKETATTEPEASVGDVIQSAIEAGLPVEAVPVSDKSYVDIGTGEGLMRAIRDLALVE
jgi:glucose-1-phosphate thymidylyltransferase